MNKLINVFLFLIFLSFASTASGRTDTEEVESLLKDLKAADFQKVWDASQRLAEFPQYEKRIAPGLIEALKNDWSQCAGDIRDSIAFALREVDARESVLPLLKLLQSGKTIEHQCADCACCFLPVTPSDEISVRAYEPFCQQGVLMTIDQFADASHAGILTSLVSAGVSRPELLITLGRIGPPTIAEFIARFKDDKDFEMRRSVATALGSVKNEAIAIPVLVRYLEDENFFVQWAAAHSLIAVGGERKPSALIQQLTGLLTKNDKIVVALTAKVLAALGDEKGVAKLRELTNDADAKIRFEAVLALGALADKGSKDLLIQRLKDPNLAVRASAIYALGQSGDPKVIPVIQKALAEASAYQESLRKKFKDDTSMLHNEYGINAYNLEVTLEEAIGALKKMDD